MLITFGLFIENPNIYKMKSLKILFAEKGIEFDLKNILMKDINKIGKDLIFLVMLKDFKLKKLLKKIKQNGIE